MIEQFSNACSLLHRRQARADREETAVYFTLGAGAVASLGLLGWYLLDGGDEPTGDRVAAGRGPRLLPILSANTQALVLDVQF